MTDILTITPNPAVDLSITIDQMVDTRKLRCSEARRDPGGGGINVARVIHRLGGNCLAVYLAGGGTGQLLQQLLDAEQLAAVRLAIAGETRENFSVTELSTGRQFRFVLPGPNVAQNEWERCIGYLEALAEPARYLVMSGSLPPGIPVDFYARLARVARERGTRTVLDSSGPALASALNEGVFLVKPSLRELRELTALPLHEEDEWRDAALEVIRDGRAQMVALTLGDQGALLVTADATLRAPALPTPVASSIGAGDSFLAAMVWALNRGADRQEAFHYGVAAASAALLSAGTGLCQRADVDRRYQEISGRWRR
ncbi:6-phosphofructokinase 2 [Cupriavidus sp. YR651]|uniref:1-phosphofructokinase family hexose kinase n=1 Tax=Cupriavidus sp. YR651 TaxID=1855315 RepID=UPI00088842CE|nr:1-phosphofructokinase family hexose kinase [Cupriavidus sp. YR651]SDD81804.1 6-phosphofructokinase 2 [Cupriavidus sp. YR651]